MYLSTENIKTLRSQFREGVTFGLLVGATLMFLVLSSAFAVQLHHARQSCQTINAYTGG